MEITILMVGNCFDSYRTDRELLVDCIAAFAAPSNKANFSDHRPLLLHKARCYTKAPFCGAKGWQSVMKVGYQRDGISSSTCASCDGMEFVFHFRTSNPVYPALESSFAGVLFMLLKHDTVTCDWNRKQNFVRVLKERNIFQISIC